MNTFRKRHRNVLPPLWLIVVIALIFSCIPVVHAATHSVDGTDYIVEHDPATNTSTLYVNTGQMVVTSAVSGKMVTVTAGQKVTVDSKGNIKIESFTPTTWNNLNQNIGAGSNTAVFTIPMSTLILILAGLFLLLIVIMVILPKMGVIQPKSTERSFVYSKKFYVVVGFDILFSFFIIIGESESYLDITNYTYHSPLMIFFIAMAGVNLLLDGSFLYNKRKDPHVIDLRLCGLKCLFGLLELNIISFLYFGTISLSMGNVGTIRSDNKISIDRKEDPIRLKASFCTSCGAVLDQNSPYCPKCLIVVNPEMLNKTIPPYQKTTPPVQDSVRSQQEKALSSIKKLRDSGHLILIDNYIKKYQDYSKTSGTFETLKELLKLKQFEFSEDELETILHLRQVSEQIMAMNPENINECLQNYLTLYPKNDFESVIRQILIDKFDYFGEVEKDIERTRKEKSVIELKKFESDLLNDDLAKK